MMSKFIRMKIVFFLMCFIGACSSSGPEKAPLIMENKVAPAHNTELHSWFEESYEEWLGFSPIQLTFLGRKEHYGEIDDLSLQAAKQRLAWQKTKADELRAKFDYETLNSVDKRSYDLWIYEYEVAKAGEPFLEHAYLFNQMSGYHSFLPNFLISFHKVDDAQDADDYISRIYGVSRAIKQQVLRGRRAAEDGIRPPRFAYEIVLEETNKLLTGQPFSDQGGDSPLWADFLSKTSKLEEKLIITSVEKKALDSRARQALLAAFRPSYIKLNKFILSDISNTTATPQGVHALPSGEAYYDYLLRDQTTTAKTAGEIHALGLEEVERLRASMIDVKNKTGFDGDLQAFFSFVRDTKDHAELYFPNTDEGREAYIQEATDHINNIKSQLPSYFGLLPEADLVVKRVEAFREQDGAPQHYYPSSPDGTRPGIYYAHLSDMLSMPRYQLEVIAYHEALPGHHMQIAIAQELENTPTFRRQSRHTAYVEGWALYSEKLAKEIPGTYQNLYAEFGRLTSEMWRAIRLVVDTGLHAKGWTEEQAVDYFKQNSSISDGAIRAEVRRYLVIPGQATSYKIGMIEIERLRKVAEGALGDKFSLAAYHDVILGGGSLPLPILEQRVNDWINSHN